MRLFFRLLLIFSLCFLGIQTGAADLPWKHIQSEFKKALNRAEFGSTPKQGSVFGQTRLLSPRTGIKDTSKLLVGIEVILEDGWTLKQPHFIVDAYPYQATVLPLFRPDLPNTENWTEHYEKYAIFPILLEGKPTENMFLNILAEWTACPPKGSENPACIGERKTYSLDLPITEAYTTIWRAPLERATLTAALDIKNSAVQIQNTLLDNGDLVIRFQFPKKIQTLDIRSEEPYHLDILNIKPDGKIWTLTFHPKEPLKIGEIIPFSLRTTYGCYTLNLIVSDDTLPALPEKLPWGIAFWSGLFFFLLSPVWCLWLKPQSLGDTTAIFRKNLLKLRLEMALAVIGLGILWFFGIEPSRWIQVPAIAWIVLFILLYLCLFPMLPIWVACLALCFFPKPFWNDVIFVATSSKIGLLIWWYICCTIPFNCWILNIPAVLNYFKWIQKENILAYFTLIRLPYILLSGWLLLALILPLWANQDEQITDSPTDLPAIVRVTEPVCLNCMRERLTLFSHVQSFGVRLYRSDSSSLWAKKIGKNHAINRRSFNLLILENGQEIILPPRLSSYDLHKILTQKLQALY